MITPTQEEFDELDLICDAQKWIVDLNENPKWTDERIQIALDKKLARHKGKFTEKKSVRDPKRVPDPWTVSDERKVAYGFVQDQLDMLYWDQVNGTSKWKDHITKVKTDHPK